MTIERKGEEVNNEEMPTNRDPNEGMKTMLDRAQGTRRQGLRGAVENTPQPAIDIGRLVYQASKANNLMHERGHKAQDITGVGFTNTEVAQEQLDDARDKLARAIKNGGDQARATYETALLQNAVKDEKGQPTQTAEEVDQEFGLYIITEKPEEPVAEQPSEPSSDQPANARPAETEDKPREFTGLLNRLQKQPVGGD